MFALLSLPSDWKQYFISMKVLPSIFIVVFKISGCTQRYVSHKENVSLHEGKGKALL